jgi:hypothetical protein
VDIKGCLVGIFMIAVTSMILGDMLGAPNMAYLLDLDSEIEQKAMTDCSLVTLERVFGPPNHL